MHKCRTAFDSAKSFIATAVLAVAVAASAVEVDYGWMEGSNLPNQFGSPGVLNTPSPTNTPSSRYAHALWTDNSGGVWLFGGAGYYTGGGSGYLNDLWFYDPSSGNWTWKSGDPTAVQAGVYGVQGVAAAGNTPGSRFECATWTGDDGKLYLFGGQSPTGTRNDLWVYNPASGLWTWLRGSNVVNSQGAYVGLGTPSALNDPGARIFAGYTKDQTGILWLIGGVGYIPADAANSLIQDVWKYDPAANVWTIMRGSNRAAAVFGTQGVPSAANHPGARGSAIAGADLNGNLWYFGGSGTTNDVWRYEISSNTWTWMKGSSTSGNPSYGTRGVASPGNTPSWRQYETGFSDRFGRFWVFGGVGLDSALTTGLLGDLWMFDPISSNWTWMEGSSLVNSPAVYGVQGSVSPTSDPGARYWSKMVDRTGTPWLFGGINSASGILNDLWKLQTTESADLAVTLNAPPSIILGNQVTYSANVTNNGPDLAEDAVLTITLPAESILGPIATTVGTAAPTTGGVVVNLGDLASGQSAAVTVVITPTIPTGTNATAQVGSLSFDPNTANNTAAAPVNVIQGDGPDYVGDIAGSQSCRTTRRGTQCRIKARATVVNTGNQNGTNKSTMVVFLSEDNKLDPSDPLVKSAGVKKLKVGRSQSKRVQIKLPLNISATGKFLIVQVDSSNTIVEGNEFNNVKVFGPLP